MSEADEAFDATLDEELEDHDDDDSGLYDQHHGRHPKGWERRDTYENPFCEDCAADPCICDEAAQRAANNELVGKIITTNYGTGPYRITRVIGPCACPNTLDSFEETWCYPAPRREPHWHFEMKKHPRPTDQADGTYYLEGHRLDGTDVDGDDRFDVIGDAGATQLELL